MSAEVYKRHRSHITAGEARARGRSRVPPLSVRAETYNLGQEVGTDYMNGNYLNVGYCDCADFDSGTITFSTATATSGNTVSGDYTYCIPAQTWGTEWASEPYQPTTVIREIIKEKEVAKEVEKRTLFKVYVVNPKKNGDVLLDGKSVIALNENQAMLKASVAEIAEKAGLDLEQVDVYVQPIGTFIRPRKDTQRVKVVKEEE